MARQSQWALAIRYFHAANGAAPDHAATLLNLGLAHDRMGGHEAAAIAESIRPARCFQYSQSALAARTASGVVAVWALAMLPSRAAAA